MTTTSPKSSTMLLLLLLINIHPSASFQQPSLSFKTHHRHQSDTIRLHANKQTYLYDGGELQSFFINNKPSDNNVISLPRGGVDTVGYVTFVASSTLIGIQAVDQDINSSTVETSTIDNEVVYSDTIATIPRGISDHDAISTAAASLVGIHCAGPKITGVGGSGDVGFYSGRVRYFLFGLFDIISPGVCFPDPISTNCSLSLIRLLLWVGASMRVFLQSKSILFLYEYLVFRK